MATTYKQSADKRAGTAARVRRHRAKAQAGAVPQQPLPFKPADADEMADWCAKNLIIPPGHFSRSLQPLVLPDYAVNFFREALPVREALMCIARKNAKSAFFAAYILWRLVGPGRYSGYRAGIGSVNREKAGELWLQIEAIAKVSGLIGRDGLRLMKSPRHIVSETGRVEILSADASAGHASGFDDVLLDELGLLKERDREFVNGLRSSVSTRGGRFIGLSIQGDAPFTEEMLGRSGESGLVVHHYAAPEGARLDDETGWHAANPGLAVGIKDLEYMRLQSQRVLVTPADAPSFRAFDLNQPQATVGAMLLDLADWTACETETLPDKNGPMVLGVDLSGGHAMSAFAGYWPETGRLEVIAAFPEARGLKARGEYDGVGSLYEVMAQRGELIETPGHTVDVPLMIGITVSQWGLPDAVVADRFDANSLTQALEVAGVPPAALVFRGMGWKEGSEDVKLFQRGIIDRRVKILPSRLMRESISGARTEVDVIGNQKLAKGSQGGRRARHKDDAVAASMLAVAAGMRFNGIYGQRDGEPAAAVEDDPFGALI